MELCTLEAEFIKLSRWPEPTITFNLPDGRHVMLIAEFEYEQAACAAFNGAPFRIAYVHNGKPAWLLFLPPACDCSGRE